MNMAGPSEPRPVRPSARGTAKRTPATSNAKTGTVTITEPLEGPTVESLQKWVGVQIPYENIADDEDAATRAVQFVNHSKQSYQSATTEIRDRWKTLTHILRGHTLSRTFYRNQPIHVPELYRIMESMVGLLEEAVLGQEPSFRVKGREKSDRLQEELIQAFLGYQLDRNKWRRRVQGLLRTMLTHQFCAVKVEWGYEFGKRIKRQVTREVGNRLRYRIERSEWEPVIYEGPRLRPVDPYDFIIDPHATTVEEALFVGDTRYCTLKELKEMARLGVYKNVDVLEELAATRDPERQQAFAARSGIHWDPTRQPQEGGPIQYEVTELHGEYDPGGGHDTERHVITVANGVCMRLQKNPYDDKHYPYAVGRCARSDFSFLNTGPFDTAIPLQVELDDFRNVAREGHMLNLMPQVWVDQDADTPDSLFDSELGSVHRSRSAPTFSQFPSTIDKMQYMEGILRRNMEEATGYMPVDFASTATAVERGMQQRNMRLRSYALGFTEMYEEVLGKMHSLNGQYTMHRTKFRVLGKAAAGMEAYEEIDPEVLNTDIDFEMVGLANLHTLGLRATGLQQYVTLAYPFAAQFPTQIDWLAMLDDLFKEMVGNRLGETYIKRGGGIDSVPMDQEEENLMLAQGQRVAIHEKDNDRDHIRKMETWMRSPDWSKLATQSQANTIKHHQEHVLALQRKKVEAEHQAKLAAQQQQAQPTDKDRGTTGDRTPGIQMNGASSPGQTPPGEAPGPAGQHNMPSADREPRLSQDQNMRPM
jgi:hypothetical protein